MNAEQLGKELRESNKGFLPQRRWIVGLELFSIVSMGVISLYQFGLTKKVAEPEVKGFDADKVNGSAQAYEILATPDAMLGLGSYTATMCLAAMAEADRYKTKPWLPLLLAAKAFGDAAFAAKLSVDQATKYKTFCLWCIASAIATFTVAGLAVPEAKAALEQARK